MRGQRSFKTIESTDGRLGTICRAAVGVVRIGLVKPIMISLKILPNAIFKAIRATAGHRTIMRRIGLLA